jgi:hypothetical protein
MNRRRALFAGLAFVGALLTLTACNGRRPVESSDESSSDKSDRPARKSGKPTLAVLVVVDQLRGDMPIRWRPLFGRGGLARLASDGAWFQDCHYPYAATLTGPGHASCASGCSPDVHGIVANDWHSTKTGKLVNCAKTERGVGPDHLLAPTLGDALKAHTKGKGKVVSLSIKDRSAVLPAGRSAPDAVYWLDKNGQFVTSACYRDAPHDWVKKFNDSGYVDRWLDREWTKHRGDVDYDKWAGPDDVAGEASPYGMGRTFPHLLSIGKGDKAKKANYYSAVTCSPMGNELLFELVKRAIDAEKLGARDEPDFLSVSFSANDLIGHAFGPDSQEVLDATLRTDEILRLLMSYLDEKVGKGRWVLVLTADHGVCPLPEVTRKKEPKKDARRMLAGLKLAEAEKVLDHLFRAKQKKAESLGKWVEASTNNMLYLNRKRLAARGATEAEVSRVLAAWVAAQPGVAAAYSREQIEGPEEDDPILRRVKRSYYRERSGDVTYVVEPYCLMGDVIKMGAVGTTHGTPYDYDTHVPLMVIGPGIATGVKSQRVSPEAAAVILAKALGVPAPEKAAVEVPKGVFTGR